jgi:hypothetical protein
MTSIQHVYPHLATFLTQEEESATLQNPKYRVILHYCRCFCGLWLSNWKQRNKTAYGIWKCNSKNFIWHCCTRHIDVWEKIYHKSKGGYFGFSKQSPLPKRNVVTELKKRFLLSYSVVLVRKRTIPSDRRSSAKLVPTFADRGCHVVSATDSHGR